MEKPEEFEPITKYEPLTKATVSMLARNLGLGAVVVNLGSVDLSKGTGMIGPRSKCMWTRLGHRITFSLGDGGTFIASTSKEIDPLHDPAVR